MSGVFIHWCGDRINFGDMLFFHGRGQNHFVTEFMGNQFSCFKFQAVVDGGDHALHKQSLDDFGCCYTHFFGQFTHSDIGVEFYAAILFNSFHIVVSLLLNLLDFVAFVLGFLAFGATRG